MYKIYSRKSFTLLEVLIAFLLIVIAAIPLLAPYPTMFKQQKKITQELEQDRLASIYFVDLLSLIFKKEIDPSKGGTRAIPTKPDLPYSASYVFKEDSVNLVFVQKNGQEKSFTYYLKGADEEKE